MTPRPQSLRVWVLTTLLLTIGTAASAILAAVTLEALMQRPSGGGSITTMMPGAVYAMATVMKVCVVSGGVAALATVGIWITGRTGRRWDTGVEARGLPAWMLRPHLTDANHEICSKRPDTRASERWSIRLPRCTSADAKALIRRLPK